MINILFSANTMGDGGSEAFVFRLIESLDKLKFKCSLIVFSNSETRYISKLRDDGFDIYRFPILGGSSKSKKMILKTKMLNTFFQSHQFDIVHINASLSQSIILLSLSVKKAKNKPLLIVHSHTESSMKNRFFHFLCRPFVASMADLRFACTQRAGRWMFGPFYRLSKRDFLINNFVDTNSFCFNGEKRKKCREANGIGQDVIFLGAVGRLDPVKNQEFLLNLLCKLPSNFCLVILGEGPLKEKLVAESDSLGISNRATFMGVSDDVPSWLDAFDAFLLPSLHEGQPVSLIEAQTSNLPCFISNSIEQGCVFSTKVFALPLNNLDEWVRAISAFFEKKEGIDFQRVTSSIGNPFSSDLVVNKIESIYERNIKE